MKVYSLITFFLLFGMALAQEEVIKDTLTGVPLERMSPTDFHSRNADVERALARMWELEPQDQRGTFHFVDYLPMYVMPFRYNTRPIEQPISLNPDRPIPESRNYQNVEAKFQVSLKAKILQDAFGKGDVWVAFTEQAYWQMYNGKLSRPFRELNYEPELIFTYPMNLSAGNFKVKMAGLSINHQSNGKEAALSRSWNRFILMGVFQWNSALMNVRLWKRFTERAKEDDNPEIENYIGRMELGIIYPFRKNVFSLRLRNNLNFKNNRGYLELGWIYPLSHDLRILLQASHGYGDSLIDYNYKQTLFGIGFTFLSL